MAHGRPRSPNGVRWPLMRNNITRQDLDAVQAFLSQEMPILTQSSQVAAFEREWSEWLGVKHSIFVNSGSSANLLTMAALKLSRSPGEIIVPPITWVSDITSVLQNGLEPVFVDIDKRTLGMDTDQVLAKVNERTQGVFLTHILGYNALTPKLLEGLKARGIPLIEDVCESHGAVFQGKKLGTFGLMSNFSFYYAHHLTTVEGGMVCTDDPELYEMVRMLRSHGLVRESNAPDLRERYYEAHPDLSREFIFAFPAYNVRSTEINAVMGRSQLARLDANNSRRRQNLQVFLAHLDPERFFTDFQTEGSCNYALTLILNAPDSELRDRVTKALDTEGIEYRRGTSGGGNQLRQPYLRRLFGDAYEAFPNAEHIHFFGFYIGNYPDLEEPDILYLCALLNGC